MTSAYHRPDDAAALANNFRVFAAADCAHEPLYASLSRAIADDGATLALSMQAPYSQRRPVLLFACVHDLLLAGVDHPLASFYRSVRADAAVADDLDAAGAAFVDFCRVHREALSPMLASRATQTNEIGRSAGLRLALASLGADRPIALIDVGCSAGLNLLVDRFRFEYRLPDGTVRDIGPDTGVEVPTTIAAGAPDVVRAMPPLLARIGIDRSPLDVRDAADARWLRACVWPSDRQRHARLARAIDLAAIAAPDLRRGDANAVIGDVLDDLFDRFGDDVRPVVFHSWVVSYFERDARRAFADRMRGMVVARDGAWISAEGPNVVPGLASPALPVDADATLREATVWHVTTREAGAATSAVIARSHPHCRWIDWLS